MNEIIAFIPLVVLIVGAVITKRIAECLMVASFLGAVFVYKGDFFQGYIDMIYDTLSNSSYQFVVIILVGFGALIKLFQESGSFLGLGSLLSRYAKGPKAPMVISWLAGFIMFVDDYLSTLAISFAMRGTTDINRIPREHLAFQTNLMAVSVCVVIPFSSWIAFTVGLLTEQGLGYSDYLGAIPYAFYPMLIIVLCLLLDVGIIPKVGPLKKAYVRVDSGGDVLVKEELEESLVDIEESENTKESSALNALIPIVVLVVTVILCDNDLVHGLLATLVVQGILYISQKIMSVKDFVGYIFEGAKSMATMLIIICFAFMLSSANKTLGFFDILISGIGDNVSPTLLPILVFLLVAGATFATAGYWLMQVIAIPIFIPLAIAMSVNPSIVIAAIMSGVTLGCNLCFYADPVFMTAAGTGVPNMKLVKLSVPYVLGAGLLAAVGFVVVGLV